MTDPWADVWARRTVEPSASVLASLMAADGLDTAFGAVSPAAWAAFAREFVTRRLGLAAGGSVFDVGCGAGAFLHPLAEAGLRVGGIDRSASLIAAARDAMPDGDFAVAAADELPAQPRFDTVVSCGVFMYFPGLVYAERVLAAMTAKARTAVAILDVPDLSMRDAALADRIAALGGEEAYTERYAGLEHVYYDRDWLAERLEGAGLVGVETASQAIPGYRNGRFRFNAWGFTRPHHVQPGPESRAAHEPRRTRRG